MLQALIPRESCKHAGYDKTLREHAYDWGELLVRHAIPEDASLYHSSYLEYLFDTWRGHLPFCVAPQHVWYTVLCEVAALVRSDPERFREVFTTSKQVQEISVPMVSGDLLPLDLIAGELRLRVPGNLADDLLPRFSCDTEDAWFARMAAFADACATYYSYGIMLCGHPRAKVLGTRADWERLIDHVGRLRDRLALLHPKLSRYLSQVSDVLQPFCGPEAALAKHLGGIVAGEPCGSGSQQLIDGWWSLLYVSPPDPRLLENFPRHVSRVPYMNWDNKKYVLCSGLFCSHVDEEGFYIPRYAWSQHQRFDAPVRQAGFRLQP